MQFTKFEDAGLWHWRHESWTSAGFPYLEQRPWTPILIDGRLCFVAADQDVDDPDIHYQSTRWSVVWGDDKGRWYDDVLMLDEHQGLPLYVARISDRKKHHYVLIWGNKQSQLFDEQIRPQPTENGLGARLVDASKSANNAVHDISWNPN